MSANGKRRASLPFQPDKVGRWPNAWLAALDDILFHFLESDAPVSVRHLYYRVTDPTLPVFVLKNHAGYNRVQRQVLKLRRAGRVPYSWIADTSRAGYHVPAYGDKEEFLRDVAGLYRQDLWAAVPAHVEVWAESRSIAGVLRSLCRELGVSLYPTGGFASATLAYEAAESIADTGKQNAIIFYVGDADRKGLEIEASLRKELEGHLRPHGVHLDLIRLAITGEHVERLNLPTLESEAMPAPLLRSIVRAAVESHLPPGALLAAKVAEASERQALRSLGGL